MQTFTSQNAITVVKRQVYTGSKSVLTTVNGLTPTCYLRPLDEVASAANGVQYGFGFSVITETSVAILIGDTLTIDSIDYTVRGMVNHNRGGATAYKKFLVVKAEP